MPFVRRLAVLLCLMVLGSWAEETTAPATSPPSRWRGFNLQEWFKKEWQQPFREEDFRLIHELGFNFVRVPMDYRIWIVDGDWNRIDDKPFAELDQAIAWGGRYGIHVSLCFHRAPGYTVAHPRETRDLWRDPEVQAVCARHWAFVARRYRDIPSSRLSFNLLNEPAKVDGRQYAAVITRLANAIHAEDPQRLLMVDGLEMAYQPCLELAGSGFIQSTRGYRPFDLSHHRAEWIPDQQVMPAPIWPMQGINGLLFAPTRKDRHQDLVVRGPFPDGVDLRLRLGTVSIKARLEVWADAVKVWEHATVCGPDPGEWTKAVFVAKHQHYQNIYDRDHRIAIPRGTQAIAIRDADGDWLTITELGLRPAGDATARESVLSLRPQWELGQQRPIDTEYRDGGWTFAAQTIPGREWLWERGVVPWQRAEAAGVRVMVGEWGAYRNTPHAVTLRWMEDNLATWQKAGWGWALWNFRGGFGVLDSKRADVVYEDWQGHQLDRRMLELLQRY